MKPLLSHSKKIAVIGNGGIAREIMCRLKRGSYNIFISESFITKENRGKIQSLETMDIDKYKVLVCIGDSIQRKKVIDSLPRRTEYFTFIDKEAKILDKKTVIIGEGSIITSGVILTTNIHLGKFSLINLHTTIGHDVVTKDFLTTAPGVHISGNTVIGKCVYLATGSVIRNKISVCDNVTVGMNSVVNKDVIEMGIYAGSPATKIK